MDMARDLGAIKKMWLNKSEVASVVPLKVLEKIWLISYHSNRGMNPGHFVIQTRGTSLRRTNPTGYRSSTSSSRK
jgi:hypothetical protein